MEDKRKYPRFDVSAKIKFKKASDHSLGKEGLVKNISAEGFCFSSKEKLDPGQVLAVEIVEAGMEESPISVHAEVVWSYKLPKKNEQGKDVYDTGLKIIGVRQTDEARFAMLYCERLLAEVKSYLRL